MNITFPLADTIGVSAGLLNDGVLLGQLNQSTFIPLNPIGNAYKYTSYMSYFPYFCKYRLKDSGSDPVEWDLITLDMNEAVATSLFQADSAGLYRTKELYIAITDDTNGLNFEITTAGVGSYEVIASYSTTNGYSPLTTATIPSDFTKTVGRNTITFTQPTDWAETFIGISTPKQKWLRLSFTGTVTTEAITTGGYLLNDTLVAIDTGFFEAYLADFYYVNSGAFFPQTGDTMYFSTVFKPIGLRYELLYPQDGTPFEYVYQKADGSLGTFTPLIDQSTGLTESNFHTFARSTFTATANNGVTSTVEGITERGYVECEIMALPTSTNNAFSIALHNAQTGTPKYEIRVEWDGSQPVAQLYIEGIPIGVPYTDLAIGQTVRIILKGGAIYFSVGTYAFPEAYGNTDLVLYPIVEVYTSGDTLERFQMVNWSENLATPETITLINDTDITLTPELAAPEAYPAIYYMYFNPPEDMAYIPPELSPTGLVGYVIGLRQVDDTTTANPVMWGITGLTADDTSNVFINTGTQTTATTFTFNTGNYQPLIGDNEFLLVLRNSVNTQTRLAIIPEPALDALTTFTVIDKATMTGFILVQTGGDDTIPVGIPSSVLLSS